MSYGVHTKQDGTMDEREMPRVPLDQSYEDWFHDALSKGLVSARSDADMQLAWQAARRTTPDREAIIEECAKVCEDYAADQWRLYKGRAPYTGDELGRADPEVQGRSNGGDVCATRIRELKTAPTSDKGGA